jgi:hypothetical protein
MNEIITKIREIIENDVNEISDEEIYNYMINALTYKTNYKDNSPYSLDRILDREEEENSAD